MGLPSERWDFSNFYSEKPDEVDSFACKVLVAGLIGIYLDIIESHALLTNDLETQTITYGQRISKIFNEVLRVISVDPKISPTDVDPFNLDAGLINIVVPDSLRDEYKLRAANLFSTFEAKFNGKNCDEILGFDPFRYEEYDEATQAKIEQGGWMENCVDCMRHVIKTTQT